MSYFKCGWWTPTLLLVSPDDDGYTLAEILNLYMPLVIKLCGDCNVDKDIKDFNKSSKFLKYKLNGIYIERIKP